jgi:hypothetical protein
MEVQMLRKWITYSLIVLLVLTITPAAFAQDGENGDDEGSYFCENRDVEHPVAAGIAETYEVDYETVIAWFCGDEFLKGDDEGNFGFGEIMLALQTSKTDDDLEAEDLLTRRAEGEGWGEIWQDLGLIGKPDQAGPPEWVGQGPPEWAGQGPPPWAGKPESKGPPWWDGETEEPETEELESSDEAGKQFTPGRPPWAGPSTGFGRP